MEINKWYTKSYRRNIIDMHFDGWNKKFLSKFSPQTYLQCLKKGKIQSSMIYLNSHVGYCNWDSKSGEVHPAFKGQNKIKQLYDLCHEEGKDVIAYYSLIYNNWAYDKHPEWRMINIDGYGSREVPLDDDKKASFMMSGLGRYGLVCPNNEDYREFLKEQFKEFTNEYEFEGIFLDMTFWPMVCFCDSCRARFKKETGYEIPEVIDWNDERWLKFQKCREDWMSDFAAFATKELKSLRPALSVENQFSTVMHPWTYGVREGVGDISDYCGGDLYGGLEHQSLICKVYYGITKNQPFEYMTSRCDPELYDHTTTKSVETLKQHAYLTYAHHGAFLVVDAMDPIGTLNEKFYNRLGEVFGETKEFEKYFTGYMESDVALFFSLANKMNLKDSKPAKALITPDQKKYSHFNATLGAGKALRKCHVPYKVLTDTRIKNIQEYKTVSFSDVAIITDEQIEIICDYVSNGGSVYLSGITSCKLANRLLGLKIIGKTAENITYIRPQKEYLDNFCGMYDEDYPMTVFDNQILAENPQNHSVIATVTLPYTNPEDCSSFASIHSNPPGINTDYPAIIIGNYGKGQVIWASTPFESSDQFVHKQVFVNLISMLNKERPLIKSDAPACVEFTLFEDAPAKLSRLSCVNMQENTPLIKINKFNVSLRTSKSVKAVTAAPHDKAIHFIQKDGYVTFNVDNLEIFALYNIEYDN